MAESKEIVIEELQELLDRNETMLVDVLARDSYQEGHIPGAVNIPIGSESFDDEFQQTVPTKDTPVVVYCADRECQASPRAAKRLIKLGYTEVYDYEDGKKGWRDAGNELEGKTRRVQADIA